jgi:putative aldouronate transport system permease protein
MGMKKSIFVGQSILNFMLFIISLSMFFPFIYILLISFTDPSAYQVGDLTFWPEVWSVKAYEFIFMGGGFAIALRNTLFITLVGTPLHVAFNAGLAYMLSKKALPGRGILLKVVVFTMLFGAGMIPSYLNMRNLGLLNTYWASILPGTCGAWTVMVMKSFFQSLPIELEEAAIIDGCNDISIFGRIILPLSKAMLATFTLFAAVSYWNTFFSAVMYVSDANMWPLQVFLRNLVQGNSQAVAELMDTSLNTHLQVPEEILKMATIVVVVLPIMLVYPFLQKHFAKGVLVGSVKG